MKTSRWQTAALAAGLVVAAGARAQTTSREPHIGYIHPAGAQKGTTVDIMVGGQFLDGATNAHLTGEGIQPTVGKWHKPFDRNDAPRIRNSLERAQQVLEKKLGKELDFGFRGGEGVTGKDAPMVMKEAGVTEEDFELLKELRIREADKKRQLNPAITEDVTVKVQIAPNAKPGPRQLRLVGANGVSNPLTFFVSEMSECRETEPNNKGQGTVLQQPLPLVFNGQVMPGDVDRFSFTARKGQKLVIAAAARELVPYLADAVPGWFQATLALSDAAGKEVAFADDFRFDPDPVLYYEVPADGQYTVEIKDSIYRGREDFVYRVTVGEIPFVTSIFPLGAPIGAPASVEVKGWNLPVTKLTVETAGKEPGIFPISVASRDGRKSNLVPFAVDTWPECAEAEPNDTVDKAQRIMSAAMVINGRIDRPGDRDVFRFDCGRGDQIVAEVYSRRLNSPLDSVLKVTDAGGRPVAANDDNEDKASALATHHADSRVSFRVLVAGAYYFHLGDTQKKGGPTYAYRLRISPERPDFELRVVPASINARAGANVPIAIYALRRDGFAGEIALELKDPPQGLRFSGLRMPAGQDRVRATITMPTTLKDGPVELRMEGVARIGGKEVRRTAVPAEDMMQAFAYHQLVPAEKWLITGVRDSRFTAPPVKPLREEIVKLRAGGTARVSLTGARVYQDSELQFELSEPPDGITIQKVAVDRDSTQIVLSADAKAVKPGLKGNLIVEAFIERGGSKGGNTQRVPVGTLPAIPFEIVAL